MRWVYNNVALFMKQRGTESTELKRDYENPKLSVSSVSLCFQSSSLLILICAVVLMLSGCRMTAPMHTWKASKVSKVGPVKVAVGPVGIASRANRTYDPFNKDLQEAAKRLNQAMQSTEPNPGSQLIAIHTPALEQASRIQLVSYDAQPNDSATIGAARAVGADYVLQGNVIDARLVIEEEPKRKTLKTMIFGEPKIPEYLVSHWTILDVGTGERIAEETVQFDIDSAQGRYFDLGYHIPGNDGRVLMASSRAAWELVASAPIRVESTLDLPWFWIGSSQVRKGNGYARQGRWDLAEREWQAVADRHPTNKAAWHNLALAAVANEDFELAWNRIRHGNNYWPGDSTFKTQLWIEKRHREYNASLGLAPPTEGWRFPESTTTRLQDRYFASPIY